MAYSCVKKTSIYIDPAVDFALTRRALRERTTKANLIRQALEAATLEAPKVRPRGRGVFSGPSDLGEKSEEYLKESGFGEA